METTNPSENDRPQLKRGPDAMCTVWERAGSKARLASPFSNWPTVKHANQLRNDFIVG
jgi:hypothetical protein